MGYFVQETESTRLGDGGWKETDSYGAEAVVDTVVIYLKPDDRQEPHTLIPGSTVYLKMRDEKPLWYYIQTHFPIRCRAGYRSKRFLRTTGSRCLPPSPAISLKDSNFNILL